MDRLTGIFCKLFYGFCSVLFIAACGGGGGDSSSPAPNSDGTINTDLSGKLVFAYHNNVWLMDISTGQYSKVPNTDWVYHQSNFGNVDDFWFDMGPIDNSEFTVTTMDDCDIEESTYATCVVIQDFNGNYSAHIRFFGDGKSPAKLSPDNQYIAIIKENIYTDVQELQIYDRSGQLTSHYAVDANDFDWLGDGSIIFAEDRKFSITEVLSAVPVRQLSLPDGLDGTIGSVEVNPSYDKFAFTLVTSGTLVSTHATPWIANTDGTGLRQLATSASDDAPPSITSPRWSPDGKWILLKVGAFTGGGPLNPGSLGYAYVVPAQNMGKTFVLSSIDSERSPEVFYLNRYERIEEGHSGTVVNKHFRSIPSWIR